MKLIHDFYQIAQESGGETAFEYALLLNKDHFIYRAHFPGNPITPGVCIIQLCKELMEHRMGKSLFLRRVENVKFLSVINPLEADRVQVAFSKVVPVNDGYKFSASVYREDVVFAKLSLCLESEMKHLGVCVLIPTYNNSRFLPAVLDAVLSRTSSVIVVNDGATDDTDQVLERYQATVKTVSYRKNRGKGYALRRGFDEAEALGYRYVITLDSDGQHAISDLPLFLEAIKQHPGAMIIGSRKLKQANMPKKNTFANRFSCFWFALQTGRKLPDTQTGFRLYPLAAMKQMRPFTSRYEAELELLVRAAWRNIPQIPIPIQVHYPPKGERITHFRPGADFLRISLLNTCLVCLALCYGYPSRLIRRLFHPKRVLP
jgi:3-hydroxymyristoyl/3-hydroxydecanoyl-(acyl carrier protein) dehydratase